MNALRRVRPTALLAAGGAAALLALAAFDLATARRPPAPVPAAATSGPALVARAGPATPGTQIAALHLFGRAAVAPPPPPPPAAAPAARPALRLAGVLAGAGPGRLGLALIAAAGAPERVYAPGATLPGGGQLLRVLDDRIELLADGRTASLALVRGTGGTGGTGGADAAAMAGRAGGMPVDAAALAAHVYAEPDPGAALARIADFERVEPGSASPAAGYRLRAGPDGRWLAQLGLRDGDIVTAIDGEALADPERALTLAAGLFGADEARLAVQRDGAPLALHLRLAATP